jgi:SRSO17 transposase
MSYRMDATARNRLTSFLALIGVFLFNKIQRASFALYAMGILGEAVRKSVEPIVAQTCADPKKMDALHQRILHFLVDAPWSNREVRRAASQYALTELTAHSPVTAWIIDDTPFLKQGKDSVGVQRQYAGSVGKIANCQAAPSLTIATARAHVPIDFELYLPRSWTDDPVQRKKARIPDSVTFLTKPEQALLMLQRAKDDGVPLAPVLADSGFGDSLPFRLGVRNLGLPFAVGIHCTTTVIVLPPGRGRLASKPIAARTLALTLAQGRRQFRRVTWRDGTKKRLSARFAFRQVVVPNDPLHEQVWLVMEWPDSESEPSKYYLVSLPPSTTKKFMVRLLKERYRTEQAYEELKGELGLDHYEGRRFPGWHHHISVVLCCYAFVIAERERHFPPCTAADSTSHGPLLTAWAASP